MTQEFNPLLDFARKVECSVKLPSNGGWYDEDVISFNALNEVNIMPMLPNDEMTLVNPETLVSGDSILNIIKSCCPGVKRPGELYYPDINALLLGIKKATYGDEITQQYICPVCWSKKNDIISEEFTRIVKERYPNGNVDISTTEANEIEKIADEHMQSKITEMERNGDICISPQEVKCSIDGLFSQMTFLPNNGIVELSNGLKVYTTPYTCHDKIKFVNKQLKYQRIMKYLEDNHTTLENAEEVDMEYLNKVQYLSEMYKEVGEIVMGIVASSIQKIELPNGVVVNNRDHIEQFLKQTDIESVRMIRENIDKLNDYGIPSTIPCECQCCGHKWDEKFYGFNQSDFFGISS